MRDPAGRLARPEGREVRGTAMATPLPRLSGRVLTAVVNLLFWGSIAAYLITFTILSLHQYDAYVPHALDLGNMAQAFWNTAHGHLFRFQNMSAPIGVEAFGTFTRLSFHVEPLLPFLSAIYLLWQHAQTLLVMQTVAVASGAIPTRLLARRRLGAGLPEIVFPLVYLLYPALEAANLYEFHPVTFAAPLLLWAYYFADARRYTLFVLVAVAAMGCKEEIGALVALIGLWIAVRNGDRAFGAVVAVLGMSWSLVALFEVVPHFQSGQPSSYWGRYLPADYQLPPGTRVTQGIVRDFWLHHPGEVWQNLTSEAKLSYLHRILFPVGYLSLLSPLTLLVALPSLALNLLSYEVHMYGGLAHYSAELVPTMVVGSILGTELLARRLAPLLRLPGTWMVAACCIYLLIAAALNHRVNGFSPLGDAYYYPPVTAHDRLIDQAVAMIPADASVSAQDRLNAHVSDRRWVFLFPDDDKKADYVLVDFTQDPGSTLRTCDLTVQIIGTNEACKIAAGPGMPLTTATKGIDHTALLQTGDWNVTFAEDGVLLLRHRRPGEQLNTALPPEFFTFMHPVATDLPPNRILVRFGDSLELDGFRVDRLEHANLRNPDVVLTTWWRVLRTPPPHTEIIHYLSDSKGYLAIFVDDQHATAVTQPEHWRAGQTYKVTSRQLPVTTNSSGAIGIDLGVTTNDLLYQVIANNQPVVLIVGGLDVRVLGPDKYPPHTRRVLHIASVVAHL